VRRFLIDAFRKMIQEQTTQFPEQDLKISVRSVMYEEVVSHFTLSRL
jgi:hypothetical protein